MGGGGGAKQSVGFSLALETRSNQKEVGPPIENPCKLSKKRSQFRWNGDRFCERRFAFGRL